MFPRKLRWTRPSCRLSHVKYDQYAFAAVILAARLLVPRRWFKCRGTVDYACALARIGMTWKWIIKAIQMHWFISVDIILFSYVHSTIMFVTCRLLCYRRSLTFEQFGQVSQRQWWWERVHLFECCSSYPLAAILPTFMAAEHQRAPHTMASMQIFK